MRALLLWVHGQQSTEAIGDFDEAIRLNPGMAQAFWQRGASYARKGDHARAIAEYDEAIRQDPEVARAYWSRGTSTNSRVTTIKPLPITTREFGSTRSGPTGLLRPRRGVRG